MRHSIPAPVQYRDLIIGIIALVLAMMFWVIITHGSLIFPSVPLIG
jgi:hypothetical protein